METQDKKIEEIKKDAKALQIKVQKIKITTDKEVVQATEMLSQVNARAKRIEEIRLSYTKPLNDSLRKINADFKMALAPYEEMLKILKRAILDFRAEQEMKRRAEEEKLRKEAERKALAEAKKNRTSQKKALENVIVPTIEKQDSTIHSSSGSLKARMVWKHRITDFSKLPDEYKVVNDKAIRSARQGGLMVIPGVEFYQEEELSSSLY